MLKEPKSYVERREREGESKKADNLRPVRPIGSWVRLMVIETPGFPTARNLGGEGSSRNVGLRREATRGEIPQEVAAVLSHFKISGAFNLALNPMEGLETMPIEFYAPNYPRDGVLRAPRGCTGSRCPPTWP